MSHLLASPTFTGTVTLSNGPLILLSNQGIQIPDGAPDVTTNKIYAVGGSLYFNGSQLAAGSGITLASPLTGFVLGTDGTALSATDTVLQGFQKLQVQVNAFSGGGLTRGSGILDFGTTPGKQYVTLTITGQTGISSATSKIKAYLMAVATAEHNAIEHAIVPMKIVCGDIVDGIGFTIHASSEFTLTGTFNVYWEY
jgi:hypothetical protein